MKLLFFISIFYLSTSAFAEKSQTNYPQRQSAPSEQSLLIEAGANLMTDFKRNNFVGASVGIYGSIWGPLYLGLLSGITRLNIVEPSVTIDTLVIPVQAAIQIRPKSRDLWLRPYLGGGVGAMIFVGNGRSGMASFNGYFSTLAMTAFAGVELSLTGDLSLAIEPKLQWFLRPGALQMLPYPSAKLVFAM